MSLLLRMVLKETVNWRVQVWLNWEINFIDAINVVVISLGKIILLACQEAIILLRNNSWVKYFVVPAGPTETQLPQQGGSYKFGVRKSSQEEWKTDLTWCCEPTYPPQEGQMFPASAVLPPEFLPQLMHLVSPHFSQVAQAFPHPQ